MGESQVVIPNARIPSVLGALNIIFGGTMLLASLLTLAWSLVLVHMMSPAGAVSAQQRAQRTKELDARLKALTAKLESEQNPQTRSQLETELESLEDEKDAAEFTPTLLGGQNMSDPRVAVPFWADHVLGMILNGLMVAAGIGLVALRPWGRTLASRVAALKLVKLVVMILLAVFLTVPLQVAQTRQMWAKLEARRGSGFSAGKSIGNEMARMTGVTATLTAVGFGVLGMIYPALCVWLLAKRSVRAACAARKPGAGGWNAGVPPPDLC